MSTTTQAQKAARFLELHHAKKLLVLPNIWDPLGARLLQDLGYPAVATASAAVAYSLGHDDGQKLSFEVMLETIQRIATAVDIPVSADIEAGYADDPQVLADNVRRVLRAGAVGINLEDSVFPDGGLQPLDVQCARISAVRAMSDQVGIPLVINARTDVFLQAPTAPRSALVSECIQRAQAYLEAGANCIYPITVGDLETLKVLQGEILAPINVFAADSTAPMQALESIGISRLSLGPGLLRASLTAMRQVARDLLAYGNYDQFTAQAISSDEIRRLLGQAVNERPQ